MAGRSGGGTRYRARSIEVLLPFHVTDNQRRFCRLNDTDKDVGAIPGKPSRALDSNPGAMTREPSCGHRAAIEELLARLELPAAPEVPPVLGAPETEVAGIRIYKLHVPEDRAGFGLLPAELVASILGVLCASNAIHLDDLLDELRELPELPAHMAVESALRLALLELLNAGVADWRVNTGIERSEASSRPDPEFGDADQDFYRG